MLKTGYELTDDVEEDEDCGCLVATVVIDGKDVAVHHWLPDDFAEHVPDSECGCQPMLHQTDTVLLYEHVDQEQEQFIAQHLGG